MHQSAPSFAVLALAPPAYRRRCFDVLADAGAVVPGPPALGQAVDITPDGTRVAGYASPTQLAF